MDLFYLLLNDFTLENLDILYKPIKNCRTRVLTVLLMKLGDILFKKLRNWMSVHYFIQPFYINHKLA